MDTQNCDPGISGAVLVWSAIGCHDYFTWLMEVFPALIGERC